ncbi:MAG: hypothetical protein AAF639_43665, partial [Chloroflexota bacterium]
GPLNLSSLLALVGPTAQTDPTTLSFYQLLSGAIREVRNVLMSDPATRFKKRFKDGSIDFVPTDDVPEGTKTHHRDEVDITESSSSSGISGFQSNRGMGNGNWTLEP